MTAANSEAQVRPAAGDDEQPSAVDAPLSPAGGPGPRAHVGEGPGAAQVHRGHPDRRRRRHDRGAGRRRRSRSHPGGDSVGHQSFRRHHGAGHRRGGGGHGGGGLGGGQAFGLPALAPPRRPGYRADSTCGYGFRALGSQPANATMMVIPARPEMTVMSRRRPLDANRGRRGLALSQELITAEGGTLTVESVSVRGSVFTIQLPRARGPAGVVSTGRVYRCIRHGVRTRTVLDSAAAHVGNLPGSVAPDPW